MALLELNAITRRYGPAAALRGVRVLDGISLTLRQGEALAVVGPSGCGKSTLLNIIGALDRPTGGSVTLDGDDLGQLPEAALADIRNRKLGFVFQQHHLLPQCTVFDNVLIPMLAGRRSRDEFEAAIARAERLLERVGLSDRRSHRPGQLSGGEAQRVAVVRALIAQPKLLLADEPTGSLDQTSARALGDLLAEINQTEGVALIVVTHSMELAERMGRMGRLANGQLKT